MCQGGVGEVVGWGVEVIVYYGNIIECIKTY